MYPAPQSRSIPLLGQISYGFVYLSLGNHPRRKFRRISGLSVPRILMWFVFFHPNVQPETLRFQFLSIVSGIKMSLAPASSLLCFGQSQATISENTGISASRKNRLKLNQSQFCMLKWNFSVKCTKSTVYSLDLPSFVQTENISQTRQYFCFFFDNEAFISLAEKQ